MPLPSNRRNPVRPAFAEEKYWTQKYGEFEDHFLRARRNTNGEAFDAFLRRATPYMYRLACRLTGNPDQAHDITQEAKLKLFQSAHAFTGTSEKGPASLKTWIGKIVINQCRDQKRKNNRRPTTSLDDPIEEDDSLIAREFLSADQDPFTQVVQRHNARVMAKAVHALPNHWKPIVIGYHLQRKTMNELAEFHDLPVGTIKSRLHRARAFLKNKLAHAIID